MKMNYVLRSNHRRPDSERRPLRIMAWLLMVLAVFYIFFPRALPSFFTMLVSPFWKGASVEEFRKAYSEASALSARMNAVQKENDELKDLLRRSPIGAPLLATVLKKPPFSAYDIFILDVGEKEGVAKGNKVYALGNIPIGEIAEVMNDTSKVRLYSSSGEKFTVSIGPSNIETTAVGRGGGYFEASLPRDTKIVPGDAVHIPSLTDSFTATVEAIASDPSEPFSKVLFRQPFNMYEMKWVLVNVKSHEN